jgi:hypothetical protein
MLLFILAGNLKSKAMSTKFFMYARKSSESEERQAKSIEDQFTEMKQFNNKENLNIDEVFQESKSAKYPADQSLIG